MKRGLARSQSAELAYAVEGEGPETVLLVMGLGGRAADWGTEFPRRLAQKYRVVRFDNRGVGASPKADGGYALSDLAADAVAVIDAVDAKVAHVIGLSMGGMIAQLIALDHASRVSRLVLMSTHFGGHEVEAPHPDAMRLFDASEFMAVGRDPGAMMRRTLSVITGPGFSEKNPAIIDQMAALAKSEPTHPSAFMAQLQAILGSDRSGRVKDIQKPTLVIHGADDKLIPPSNGRRLAERIPGAKLALLEGIGHMPMIEAPEDTARRVLEFFA